MSKELAEFSPEKLIHSATVILTELLTRTGGASVHVTGKDGEGNVRQLLIFVVGEDAAEMNELIESMVAEPTAEDERLVYDPESEDAEHPDEG
jgi:hypothetical protein